MGVVDKIRVGVVGVGALGQHHANVYASLPEASLIGVADTLAGRAEEVARPLGIQCVRRLSAALRARWMPSALRPPLRLHAEIGQQFLEQGIDVLVEKPISHSLDDADRLIRAAARSGRVLQVGHSSDSIRRSAPSGKSSRDHAFSRPIEWVYFLREASILM